MYQYIKHFTLDEAISYIPKLQYEVTKMRKIKNKLDRLGFNIYTRKYRPGFNPDTLTEYPDKFIQLMDIIQSLQDEGILVKGIEEGLVDFPALRKNGMEVFLCWKEGESAIAYWHSLEGGFRGRQPIEKL
jgi:hypothetical protein